MAAPYGWIEGLYEQVEVPANGILSRALYEDADVKMVLFGFSAGQELSEHTASRPASIFFLKGEGQVRLGADTKEAAPGTWIHMPPRLPHAIKAETPLAMLLILMRSAAA